MATKKKPKPMVKRKTKASVLRKKAQKQGAINTVSSTQIGDETEKLWMENHRLRAAVENQQLKAALANEPQITPSDQTVIEGPHGRGMAIAARISDDGTTFKALATLRFGKNLELMVFNMDTYGPKPDGAVTIQGGGPGDPPECP